ncbi:SGNH/GDSL hydrolase family protein [uncultured Jatrophihabitans sp.]|uniref:SGNH/GDSL hydrolase family protein n=1 Tax=uncultured Jatrophihabitans sp. TaxID=1610747 RepID=UPI0035C97F67
MPRLTKLAVTAASLAAVAGVAFAATTASGATSAPLNYVGMGDSYSAASGNVPPDPSAAPQCLRSTVNYPHLIAATTGAKLTDVTCGGAQTKDYFSSQYQGLAPQLDALSSKTQLITMTIGGNDSNVFIDSIVECGVAGATTAGQGSPCKDRYGSSFDNTINHTTYPSLVKTLQAVHAKAPHARVAILGYLQILPKSGGCYPQMPVASGDVPYLDDIQATLNSAVKRAAAATGTTYVDATKISQGHDACQAEGVRYVEPVIGGTNPVIVHPTALGESTLAQLTITTLHLHCRGGGPARRRADVLTCCNGGMRETCSVCGRQADPQVDGDPPLAWSAEPIGDAEGTRWVCAQCTREHVRAIEAKLDPHWW